MFSSTNQLPLACSLLCTMFKINFHPSSGFLLLHRFSTAMFLLSACCPRQRCPACSRHWYLLPMGNAFFCCRHSLRFLIQGPGSLSTDYDSLQVRLPHSAAFSVSFVRALQPDFHSLSPELGLVCAGFFLLFCLGWGGLPVLGSSFICGSITADECPPLREHQFVCLSCVSISLFCLASSLLM